MDSVAGGELLVVITADGKSETLSTVSQTRAFLKERFGWTADVAA
jgi:hypothetical protein